MTGPRSRAPRQIRPWLEARVAERLARRAEEAGLESLWVGEHVVLPDPRVAPSPMEPTDPILDPLISLTFLAAVTRTIRLGTGIIILPQRNPLVLAKQLASLDVLSGGRLIFGVGVGYLEPEFRALGIPSATTARALTNTWPRRARGSHKLRFDGTFVSFSDVNAYPPIQRAEAGRRRPFARRAADRRASPRLVRVPARLRGHHARP
jgi:alkanesulfonate monooxygenase SsuD/methylene tetrahydromethanopterin reductase-like flavin-dependent oxidoreductase (luciferase family)